LEDANFEQKRADSAVTMLYVEEIFARAAMRDPTVGKKDQLQLRDGELSYFVDRAFKNELGAMIAETLACYESMRWRDGIQAGAFGLQLLRDAYRDWCAKSGVPMHSSLLVDYARVQAALLAPVCPHFSHHVWFDVLKETKAISWPEERPVDKALSRSYGFLRSAARQLRLVCICRDDLSRLAQGGAQDRARRLQRVVGREKGVVRRSQERPGVCEGRTLREAGEARHAVWKLPARLRRRGRLRCIRRRPALLPGPDSGRVEDLRPEEHLRRRLRYYDRRPGRDE
jgi:hypothetical protein